MDRLKAMQVFVEVADRGSLSAAAMHLDMSRAMVSRYLAEMEQWVGVRLLHRTTRRLSLTPGGAETLPRCRRTLEMVAEMHDAIAIPSDAPRGQLRIATSMSLGTPHLASAIADFVRRYPGTSIDMLVVERPVNLAQERVDLAVRMTNDLDANLSARKLAVCRSVVCASPAYIQSRGAPSRLEDLALHNCLTDSCFGKGSWRFQRGGAPVTVPVCGNVTANDASALMHAAIDAAGIVLLPVFLAAPQIAAGRLQPLLADCPAEETGIYGIYQFRRQIPLILETMLDFLAERFATMPWDPQPL